jgi:hypothetical protein
MWMEGETVRCIMDVNIGAHITGRMKSLLGVVGERMLESMSVHWDVGGTFDQLFLTFTEIIMKD